MKKFIVLIVVYLFFLMIPMNSGISANSNEIKYQIHLASKSKNSLEVKENVLTILEYICDGVLEDSYKTMIQSNLSLFEKIEDSKVKWKNDTLIIKIGNGKGTIIHGEYEKNKICLDTVKPKSKIMEWLGME